MQKVEPFNLFKFIKSPMGLMAVGMVFVRTCILDCKLYYNANPHVCFMEHGNGMWHVLDIPVQLHCVGEPCANACMPVSTCPPCDISILIQLWHTRRSSWFYQT